MKKLLLILLLLPIFATAQYKVQPLPVGLMFISGAGKGTADYLQFHYEGKSQFWQPDISWKNKWKNGDPAQGEKFPGSSTLFVCTTDGWHMCNMIHKTAIVGAITLKIGAKKKPFRYYLYDFLIYSAAYSAGFVVTYELFPK